MLVITYSTVDTIFTRLWNFLDFLIKFLLKYRFLTRNSTGVVQVCVLCNMERNMSIEDRVNPSINMFFGKVHIQVWKSRVIIFSIYIQVWWNFLRKIYITEWKWQFYLFTPPLHIQVLRPLRLLRLRLQGRIWVEHSFRKQKRYHGDSHILKWSLVSVISDWNDYIWFRYYHGRSSAPKYDKLNLSLTSIAVTLVAKWFVFTLSLVQAALGAAFGSLWTVTFKPTEFIVTWWISDWMISYVAIIHHIVLHVLNMHLKSLSWFRSR